MEISVTYNQRVGLALYLQGNWGAAEETLYAFADAHEAFRLQEIVDTHFTQTDKGVQVKDFNPSAPQSVLQVQIPTTVAEAILSGYPMAPTPAVLGPSKVALLRALRVGMSSAIASVDPRTS